MNGLTRVQNQAKTTAVQQSARVDQSQQGLPAREVDRLDIATQMKSASRLGHSLSDIRVDHSAPPAIHPSAGGSVSEARQKNRTGLPDSLKSAAEDFSGFDLSDVRVHRNSRRPAQVEAQAFARGPEIHLAPGQEKHLAHELWHVVQQKRELVRANAWAAGQPVNDDAVLEGEADGMAKKLQGWSGPSSPGRFLFAAASVGQGSLPLQRNGDQLKKLKMAYQLFWSKIKKEERDMLGLPKPSDANNVIAEVSQDGVDTAAQLKTVIKRLVKNGSSLVSLKQGLITSMVKQAEEAFASRPAHKELESKGLSSGVTKKRSLEVLPSENVGYLSKADGDNLERKLGNERFQRKLMDAGNKAVKKWGEQNPDVASNVKRDKDLGSVVLDPGQMVSALGAFKEDKQNTEALKFGMGVNEQQISIGAGGLQLHGLGTYPEEILWFNDFLGRYKVNPTDLEHALAQKNPDLIKQLVPTISEKDMYHLLRLQALHALEIFRGPIFALGLVSHQKLSQHGEGTHSTYMANHPMMEQGATTNLRDMRTPRDEPKDSEMFKRQRESNASGINRLARVDLKKSRMFDPSAKKLFGQLEDEKTDESEAGEELVDASLEFMRSQDFTPLRTVSELTYLQGEERVDQITRFTVQDYIERSDSSLLDQYSIYVVDGTDWTCYIRAVLRGLGRMGDYEKVLAALSGVKLSNGVEVGSEQEDEVQAAIEKITGQTFFVYAQDPAHHGNAARSKNARGQRITLLRTGAHFSLATPKLPQAPGMHSEKKE